MKCAFLGLSFFFALVGPVQAFLNGFEGVDGYRHTGNPFPTGTQSGFSDPNYTYDVHNYNAGQFGTTTGGVDNGATNTAPASGTLWQRLAGQIQPLSGAVGHSYATAHRQADKDFINSYALNQNVPTGGGGVPADPRQALIITTNADGWNAGPSVYSYQLDQYDHRGGTGPSTPTAIRDNNLVHISFWACAQIAGKAPLGQSPTSTFGLPTGTTGNIISFLDSTGAVGFEIGYEHLTYQPSQLGGGGDNLWYRAGNATAGATTNFQITPERYHQWNLTFDMVQETVTADVFDPFIGGGTTFPVIPAGTPTLATLSDLTELRFTSSAGVDNRKFWSLDDFSFDVAEIAVTTSRRFDLMAPDRDVNDFHITLDGVTDPAVPGTHLQSVYPTAGQPASWFPPTTASNGASTTISWGGPGAQAVANQTLSFGFTLTPAGTAALDTYCMHWTFEGEPVFVDNDPALPIALVIDDFIPGETPLEIVNQVCPDHGPVDRWLGSVNAGFYDDLLPAGGIFSEDLDEITDGTTPLTPVPTLLTAGETLRLDDIDADDPLHAGRTLVVWYDVYADDNGVQGDFIGTVYTSFEFDYAATAPIPEPCAAALLGLGGVLAALTRDRQRTAVDLSRLIKPKRRRARVTRTPIWREAA